MTVTVRIRTKAAHRRHGNAPPAADLVANLPQLRKELLGQAVREVLLGVHALERRNVAADDALDELQVKVTEVRELLVDREKILGQQEKIRTFRRAVVQLLDGRLAAREQRRERRPERRTGLENLVEARTFLAAAPPELRADFVILAGRHRV